MSTPFEYAPVADPDTTLEVRLLMRDFDLTEEEARHMIVLGW